MVLYTEIIDILWPKLFLAGLLFFLHIWQLFVFVPLRLAEQEILDKCFLLLI